MSSVQPPAPYVPPTQAPTAPVEGEAVPAEITKLPPTLNTTDRALTLRGEVVAQNQDGSVRIATPRGPIDVKLPDPVPQRGQSVEVQIPAGSPPRTATVTVPQQQLPQTPVPLPQQPPAQNLPSTPAPLTNAPQPSQPPVAGTPPQQGGQPAPQPQVPAQPNVPVDEIVPTPRPNPNVQTPAQPNQPQGAQPQNAEPQLSPQGLMTFLKSSLTTLLKSPVADITAQPNQATAAAQSQTVPLQQRSLQLGQMLRLTLLPNAQNVNTAPTPATPNVILPGNTPASIATPQTTQTLILLPQTATTSQAPLLQQAQQAVATPSVAITTQQGAALPVTVDPLARLLMPNLQATASPHITPNASVTPSTATQIPTLTTASQIALTPEISPHQPIIAARPGMQIPALTQPMDVRVTAMLPSAPSIAMQSPAMATLLHGTPTNPVMFARVAGQTPQGFPVVELPTFTTAPDGTQKPATTMMVLQFPARAIPPSTILRLDILPMAPNTAAPALASFSGLSSLGEAITWDALDDVMKATGLQPQGQAANALQAALPKPGAVPFTAPVMMLAAAMKGGDIAQWLGEKGLEAIKTSRHADALARIGSDFSVNKSRMDEPAQSGEWKSLSLPMLYGQDVGRIQLYYRSFTGGEGEGNQSEKKNGTRFVMDLSLNRMGPMQIDGFSLGNRLDITLRSEQTLSTAMREQMRIRYSEAVNGIGFAGELNFNANPDHKGWVVMDDESRLSDARA